MRLTEKERERERERDKVSEIERMALSSVGVESVDTHEVHARQVAWLYSPDIIGSAEALPILCVRCAR